MPDYVTTKMYTETRKALRLIAAQTGEQMVQVVDRLCQEELRKRGLNGTANGTESADLANAPHQEGKKQG